MDMFGTVLGLRFKSQRGYLVVVLNGYNGYNVMNCFAKFEKFLPHSIIISSFMSVGSQMPELDQGGGGFLLPPHIK